MPNLQEALEASRPTIEAALADAEQELAELNERRRELEHLIGRARAALGQPVPTDPRPRRLTLHAALERVLHENDNRWMTVKELADEVNTRELYEKRDGTPVAPSQIHARATSYPGTFEKDGPLVRLRGDQ